MKRRELIKSGLYLGGVALLPSWVYSLAQAQAAKPPTAAEGPANVLVVIILRGAMDGLSLVAPIDDPRYKILRPSLALENKDNSLVKLAGPFALHPQAKDLHDLWKNKNLNFIVQTGSPDPTRSHFDAQDFLETGAPGVKNVADGFLNRTLLEIPHHSQFSAVALQPIMPRILQGHYDALAMNSLKNFNLKSPFRESKVSDSFESMYAETASQALHDTAVSAFHSIQAVNKLTENKDFDRWVKQFPNTPTAKRLAEIAWLIKNETQMRVAVTDVGGWDTHVNQGANSGRFADRMTELTGAIGAFHETLGNDWSRVTLVTVTEFGRTVAENGTRGTDHGHGSVMMVAGGGIQGGRVLGHWTELKKENLYEERDVPVTTDYRQVFAEILGHPFAGAEHGANLSALELRSPKESEAF